MLPVAYWKPATSGFSFLHFRKTELKGRCGAAAFMPGSANADAMCCGGGVHHIPLASRGETSLLALEATDDALAEVQRTQTKNAKYIVT